VAWVYQKLPFDEWDYDGVNENVLIDVEVDGEERKALHIIDRTGFAFLIDRETGMPLHREVRARDQLGDGLRPRDRAAQRRPAVQHLHPGHRRQHHRHLPDGDGRQEHAAVVLFADTGLIYAGINRICMNYEPYEVEYTAGQPYVGATLTMMPSPEDAGGHGGLGSFIAWDPVAAETVWEIDEPFAVWSGALTTAGGLAFYGTLEGYIKAVDRRPARALAVQDPVRDHRQRQHLRARGQAVRRRPLGRRRLGRHRPRGGA
jgi:lanthanide-dependent methanol dehydrogenase